MDRSNKLLFGKCLSTNPNFNIANEGNGLPKRLNSLKRSTRNLVGSEGDLDEASKLLNHADTSTTAKYFTKLNRYIVVVTFSTVLPKTPMIKALLLKRL